MERSGDDDIDRTVPVMEPKHANDGGSSNKHQEGEEDEVGSLGRRVLEENKKLWVVAGPSICARFSTFGITVVSLQAFIGHIGATELAAYAIISTVLMRFSVGILLTNIKHKNMDGVYPIPHDPLTYTLGMASALETLCGQSYGAKQYHMLGIYLQRSWIVLFCCAVLLTPIYIFTTPLLIALGQDPKISAMAGIISLWYIPVMMSYVWGFTLQMYLQAQSKNMFVTYLMLLNLGLHLFLSWLLTVKFHLGLAGVLSFMVIAYWIPILGQLAFVFYGGCPETWTGFSSAVFTDLGAIIKLSLSRGVMLCLNINSWEMVISLGFLAATGMCVVCDLPYLSWKHCIHIAVVDAVADLSPLLAFSILLNSVQPVLSGVAIGSGWQSVVANINVTSYYLIGIPIGAILGNVLGFQVKGIWIGMLLGTLVQTIVLLFITLRADWEKQVEIARERLNRWYMDENGRQQNSRENP
uniref:Protein DETOXIFICATION n=1 Tax=Leersia perrieri TaxID=77586 RepID=A0A0D9XNM1_9ORYZ